MNRYPILANTTRGGLTHQGSRGTVCLVLCALCSPALLAQTSNSGATTSRALGITSQGSSGGLVIPSAQVLSQGTLALTQGNYQEPQLGSFSTRQSMSLGIGLMPHVELFGRYTNYVNPPPANSILVNGVRDLSANLKLQLPLPWQSGPQVALGWNDFTGGAVNFGSRYLVASQQLGPVMATLGYASAGNGRAPFSGGFGGVDWRLGETGLSVLAEHDGQQKHAGLRWQSPPLALLGQAQLTGSLHRTFGATTPSGTDANGKHFSLSLFMPLGDNQTRLAGFKPEPSRALPAVDAKPGAGMLPATPEDRMASLHKALLAVGLERVRVGQLGSILVVEYENHRYAHNEADAIGLVLGLAAELAPPGMQRVHAVTLKQGLRLYETSVEVAAYRAFLRDGLADQVRDSLNWNPQSAELAAHTQWFNAGPSASSRLRIELKPDLNYTLGTEVGSFDHALAANVHLLAPLWTGAQIQGNYVAPLSHSSNMNEGAIFESARQRRGLKSLALGQSIWLGEHAVAQVAVGRFDHDTLGVQAEATVFVPNSDHLLRLRGASGPQSAYAASYRLMLSPSSWIEAGAQRYTDASQGPSIEWNRWFGDVGVQLFYRKGGDRQFAGLQLNFPLTPRQGMAPGAVSLAGASHYAQSIRTRLTSASQAANLVQPQAVRDVRLETSLENDLFNAGRMSQSYFSSQVPRMREAFYLYARNSLPD